MSEMVFYYEADLDIVDHIPERKLLKRGFRYLGSGRHRQTFLFPSGKYVIKFPYREAGVDANYEEARLYKKSPENKARCRLIMYNSLPCIIMEKVDRKSSDGNLPEWVNFVDCYQVGCNRKGQLVAYDYAE